MFNRRGHLGRPSWILLPDQFQIECVNYKSTNYNNYATNSSRAMSIWTKNSSVITKFAFAQSQRPSWRPSWILLRNKLQNESVCFISILFIKVMLKITPNSYKIVQKYMNWMGLVFCSQDWTEFWCFLLPFFNCVKRVQKKIFQLGTARHWILHILKW